ncbi:MAG: putative sulfate exporter family transporter [Phycisphaerales bacterium]
MSSTGHDDRDGAPSDDDRRADPGDGPDAGLGAPATRIAWPNVFGAWAISGVICAAGYQLYQAPVPPFSIQAATGVRHPLGAAMVAMILGIALRNLLWVPPGLGPALRRVVRFTIPAAIVLGAAELDLRSVAALSLPALAVTLACIAVSFAASIAAARWLGLSRATSLMLGAGTAICGNSAVVAVAPLVDAKDDEVGIAVGTVNLMGLAAMLALPPLGEAMSMSASAFGVWAGTTIHSVPQVAAAGEAFGREAAEIAMLVKLFRVAMLAPLVFVIVILAARGRDEGASSGAGHGPLASIWRYGRLVPWFVWGFIGVAALNTLGLIPSIPWPSGGDGRAIASGAGESIALGPILRRLAGILLAMSMAAIGLEIHIRTLLRVGFAALVAGAFAAVVLVLASIGLTAALL